jgi:hypothetical protein
MLPISLQILSIDDVHVRRAFNFMYFSDVSETLCEMKDVPDVAAHPGYTGSAPRCSLLLVVPRDLGFDQALEPVRKRAAIFLRKALSRRFDG